MRNWKERFMEKFTDHVRTGLIDTYMFKWGEGTDPRLIADFIEQERILAQIEVLDKFLQPELWIRHYTHNDEIIQVVDTDDLQHEKIVLEKKLKTVTTK